MERQKVFPTNAPQSTNVCPSQITSQPGTKLQNILFFSARQEETEKLLLENGKSIKLCCRENVFFPFVNFPRLRKKEIVENMKYKGHKYPM